MALLCLVTLGGGLLSLTNPPGETSAAIRAHSVPRASPELLGSFALLAAAPASDVPVTTSTTRPPTTVTTRRVTTTSAPTTSTSRPAPAPAAAPAPVPATTPPATTSLTPLTTVLEKVVPPAVAVAGTLTRTDSGVASWFGAPAATCAHRTLPMGTLVTVTRIHNGATATCKVDDRGPSLETGRLIDLSLDTFEKLAASEAGLIDVMIEW